MQPIQLILNGKSSANEDVRTAIYKLRSEGVPIQVHVTWEGGDAARFAGQYADRSDCLVVAGGGDGTVNEVVNGLFASGRCACAFGILPLGTANDFATSLNIPISDPYQALLLAASSAPQAIDVAKMNERYFVNVASGGFGAEVTSQTPTMLKNAIGGSAYALVALVKAMKSSAYPGKLITPDKTYEGSVVMFAAGNGRQAGGGAHMTPDALINDGLLDVMLVPDHDEARFSHLIMDLARLKLNSNEGFHYLRVPTLKIESDKELQVNLDGEPIRGKSFLFEVLPGALQMVLPTDCPLLR
jgi:lipid kinase YegS